MLKQIISVLLCFSSFAQSEKNQIYIQTGAGYTYGSGFAPLSQELGGGYYFKEGISIGAQLWNLYNRKYFGTPKTYPVIDILNLAFNASYRPLRKKILSPSIQINVGLPIYSNANGKFVTSDNYYIVPAHPNNPEAPILIYTADIFEKSPFNYNVKLMLDVKYNRIGFLFGPTINKYTFKFINLGVYSDQNGYPWVNSRDPAIRQLSRVGMEIQFRYYFN